MTAELRTRITSANVLRRTAGIALLSLAACTDRSAALDFQLAGCSAGTEGERCLITKGSTLALWLPISIHDRAGVRGPVRELERRTRGTGVLISLAAGTEYGALEIEAETGTTTRRLALVLAPGATATSTPAAAFAAARRALRGGDTASALSQLARAERGDAFLARRAAMLGAYVAAVMAGDQVEAERRLARVGSPVSIDGEGAALADYHRGLLHAMAGDRRAALEALERAERTATRLDLPLHAQIRELEAIQLLEIGRAEEAVRYLSELARSAAELDPRARADLLNNLASARIVAGTGLADARGELQRALADYASIEAVADANNARVSLALLELEDGRTGAARAQLASVTGPELPITAAWRRLLDARIALAAGELERACTGYRRLADDARRVLWPAIEAEAERGLGGCLERRGRDREALAAYLRARDALDAGGASVPIDRSTLERADGRAEVEAALVALWLKLGSPEEAFAAARENRLLAVAGVARARAAESMSSLERERWLGALAAYRVSRAALDRAALDLWQSTTADAPRAEAELLQLRADVVARLRALLGAAAAPRPVPPRPAPGELRLLSLRIAGRTVILAGASDAVLAATVPDTRAIEQAVDRAQRLLVISTPAPELAALLGARPWAYTTDLPAARAANATRRALVVADPRRDLPHARREGEEVAEQLRARGWRVDLLVGFAAGRAAIESRLGEIGLLHYAGHGRDRRDRTWDGALLLADGELEVADIVATSTVPPFVVLSGCETAVLDRGDLTLAQAFAVAGARAVVATSTAVGDDAARAFARRLYDVPAEGWSLADAFARARAPSGVFRLLMR